MIYGRGSIKLFFRGDSTLKGCWSFEQGAIDESGNNNHGTINGAVPAIGRFDKCLKFTNSYVSIPSSDSLNITTAITIAAWIKPDNSTTESTILGKWYQNASNWSYVLYSKSGSGGGFRLYNGSSNFVQLTDWSKSPTIGKWSFIVATWSNSSGVARVFLNGQLVGTQTNAFSTILITNNPVWIGNEGYNNYFAGLIDEVAVFSRALSPAEISAYYKWAIGARNKSIFIFDVPSVINTRRRLLLSTY
jgi:hypothetical protein